MGSVTGVVIGIMALTAGNSGYDEAVG